MLKHCPVVPAEEGVTPVGRSRHSVQSVVFSYFLFDVSLAGEALHVFLRSQAKGLAV